MSKHVRTATAGTKLQANPTLAHPHGIPVLLHPDGTVLTCNPGDNHHRIGTYDKQSDNLSLTPDEPALQAAIAAWRAEQHPRSRTERVTAYRGFLKKTKARNLTESSPLPEQTSAGEAAAAEDNSD